MTDNQAATPSVEEQTLSYYSELKHLRAEVKSLRLERSKYLVEKEAVAKYLLHLDKKKRSDGGAKAIFLSFTLGLGFLYVVDLFCNG